MAELDPAKVGYSLTIDGKYYNDLDIQGFSQMMKDPSYCYKFYWLEAIVQLISLGIRDTTFDEVITLFYTFQVSGVCYEIYARDVYRSARPGREILQ